MEGMLLVDKPAGWTSFDVVNFIRKEAAKASDLKPKQIKVGHSGTLDPFATGLLIVLVGKAYTSRAEEFSKLDKTYEFEMKLGSTSSTGDPEGQIKSVSSVIPTLREVKSAISKFRGDITQVPPAYSAIKIKGERAYKLARRGEKVTMPPRSVTIKEIKLIDYTYPSVKLFADVSSGTYIRTLVEDIGNVLGTKAYTTSLRRLSIGDYSLDQISSYL